MSMRRDAPDAQIKKPTNGFSFQLSNSQELKWSDLSETEKSAASLGVSPEAWNPIAFLNTAHYDSLLKANSIDVDLAKRLEAYKHVAAGGS